MKPNLHCIYRTGKIHVLTCFLLTGFSLFAQDSLRSITDQDKPTLISSGFKFTEGPAVDKEGNIFFTDQPNNRIWKYDVNGKLTIFLDTAGRSNGMYFDTKGNLITCADRENQLWTISPERTVTVLLNGFNGHRFNGPNDVWINHQDGIYFTDPYFQRDYWVRKAPDPEIKGEKLYYLARGKKEAMIADENLKKPNGIVGVDEKYLFVSDMGVGKIFKYSIGQKGELKDRHVFANDLADGMTLDDRGNLYLAGNGITVYDSIGKKIGHFDVPSAWTANCCFGGAQKNILFITASESVYMVRMKVRGID